MPVSHRGSIAFSANFFNSTINDLDLPRAFLGDAVACGPSFMALTVDLRPREVIPPGELQSGSPSPPPSTDRVRQRSGTIGRPDIRLLCAGYTVMSGGWSALDGTPLSTEGVLRSTERCRFAWGLI